MIKSYAHLTSIERYTLRSGLYCAHYILMWEKLFSFFIVVVVVVVTQSNTKTKRTKKKEKILQK